MENKGLKNTMGLAFILGLIYCVFIYIENQFFYKIPTQFTTSKTIFYLLILAGLLGIGFYRRKELGGFIGSKEAFQAILVSIVIIEVMYAIFGFVYIKYIDPTFIEKQRIAWAAFYKTTDLKKEQIDEIMVNFNEQEKVRPTLKAIFGSTGIGIVLDSIAGFIIALAVKKEKKIAD